MSTAAIHGLVLAGGRGARMGGLDKGLQLLAGQPLVAHVLARLAPQAAPLLISANRHLDTYAAFGHPVLPDPPGLNFAGPLAGMLAGLNTLPADAWLLTAPCDCPHLPADLAARLLAAAQPHGLA
ncbi:molybdenum cofactor guanylyltransferase MobA, partial [Pelomonas sp. HMWF004]